MNRRPRLLSFSTSQALPDFPIKKPIKLSEFWINFNCCLTSWRRLSWNFLVLHQNLEVPFQFGKCNYPYTLQRHVASLCQASNIRIMGTRYYVPNIIVESEGSLRFLKIGAGFVVGAISIWTSPSSSVRCTFDDEASPDCRFWLDGWGELTEGTRTKPSLSLGDCRGLSISISRRWRSRSRGRFPSTELEELGDCEVRKGARIDDRDGPSSTRVASVSFEESVPPLSTSSSSSSLDVIRASLASSIVGVTAAASQYSKLKNNSASWLMTEVHPSQKRSYNN